MSENHLLESVGKRVTCALVEAFNSRPVYEVQQISLINHHKIQYQKQPINKLTLLNQDPELGGNEDKFWESKKMVFRPHPKKYPVVRFPSFPGIFPGFLGEQTR